MKNLKAGVAKLQAQSSSLDRKLVCFHVYRIPSLAPGQRKGAPIPTNAKVYIFLGSSITTNIRPYLNLFQLTITAQSMTSTQFPTLLPQRRTKYPVVSSTQNLTQTLESDTATSTLIVKLLRTISEVLYPVCKQACTTLLVPGIAQEDESLQ
ncbi:hypothetical protein M758_9G135100 [Ceratodon purpureus]|nr:hypothetical protein M758_9G135100 [Ceratodon purpureus]